MFWKNKDNGSKGGKLPGPKDIHEIVKKQINPTMIDPDTIPYLKFLTKNSEKGEKVFDFRIYDPAEAEAWGLKVANYDSLDGKDDLIISDGSYEELTKQATVNMRRNIPKYKLFTNEEILQQVETLKNAGDSVFFYTAAGVGSGGPLGRGAVVVKLNPTNGEKKRKKYGIYGTSVINMKPVSQKEALIFDSDKSKDVAKWIADAHKARFC